ncbi:uncharacterized protein BDZ99DRAFT_469678 [Mytilinidion resinicola]|uniref:Uncharacterized protein n=1 Tax=Mytilinidion resinicola TaxID=574789 RepID=A0A6A6Y0L2_9PEZI|nr:uncharacterized protein BDZ99DRAFT_469678 [Mytilinidion resinicola]KAF2801347.1 hypothetical protein BDZ99DRAFT_469678 [Mytilinidion resinicola]
MIYPYLLNHPPINDPEWGYEIPGEPASSKSTSPGCPHSSSLSSRSPELNMRFELAPFHHSPQQFETAMPTPQPTPKSCHCLESIIFLLEDVDMAITTTQGSTPAAALASRQEAVTCCQRLLKCLECITRVETLIPCEKLVTLCSIAVKRFVEQLQRREVDSQVDLFFWDGSAIALSD